MPLEQTITIVNNSGKIISTGKQLFSIFKDAKESYSEKKAEIKTIQRAQTFDQARSVNRHPESVYEGNHYHYHQDRTIQPRRSFDGYSEASSRRSHRSRSVRSKHHGHGDAVPRSRPALTEYNLKTMSEVSSVAPSRAKPPNAYRSPYAETIPWEVGASRMDLSFDARSMALTQRGPSQLAPAVSRRRSESEMGGQRALVKHKEIDMDLAYGSMPPDLEQMVELDPAYKAGNGETKAKLLVGKVEGLLDEAHCLQSSAGAIIKRLQEDPNAAASVALTLTELSKVVTKMSPAFLGLLKGSSPAVFGLLASPQFLIGTSIIAGVTVVMFGGWKIVKKVKENQVAREALGYEGAPAGRPALPRTQSEASAPGFDEALVLDDELSTIESWRRGIPFGDDASADLELITPEADRAHREQRQADDFDTRSRRTARTTKTTKTHRSSKKDDREKDVPERKSSRRATTAESVSGGSERSSSSRKKHSSTSSSSSKSKRKEVRAIEDGKRNEMDLVVRSKGSSQSQGSNMLKALFKNKDRERSMILA